MTKKEMNIYKSAAKAACRAEGIKVLIKNMTLLETGMENGAVNYVMFKDRATGKQYQCYIGWDYYTADHRSIYFVQEYKD